MAHHSLLRESLIPTSSPLRRKSVLNLNISDTSLRQNDDDAERMERRRNTEIEMRQRDSVTPPTSDKRKSIGGAIAGLSPTQLAEHYANCIKLSAENKINTKNAFSLQLIDYMAMMLKKRDSKMDNFQVASCTLDASTKIYAYRVDSVHTDVLKMAGGLAVRSRKKDADNEGEGGGDGGEGDHNSEEVLPSLRKRRTRKPKNTVASNIETLNGKPDLNYSMDPFFLRSTSNMSDCQPGDSHFLTSLKVINNCSLMLCSDIPYWRAGDDIASNADANIPLPPIPGVSNKSICSVFSQFRFTSWSLDSEEESDYSLRLPPVSNDVDNDYAFDVNAVPEPVPVCDSDMLADNCEAPGMDVDVDSDAEEAPAACAAAQRSSDGKVVDLRKHLSTYPSEYSYFRAGSLNLWAGPSHWKIRPLRQTSQVGSGENIGNKKRNSKRKELTVSFEAEDVHFLTESNSESLKLTKRTVQKVWNAEKNTNPPDVHYDCKHFKQLQIRRFIGVGSDHVPIEDDCEKDHDTADSCPNVELPDEGGGGDDDDEDGFHVGQHKDVHTNYEVGRISATEMFAGDNLVTPPNKVPRLFIPYAQRAKKMDMKKLKAAIWDILINIDAHK